MNIARRALLLGPSAGLAVNILGVCNAWAATSFDMGDMQVTTLNDGFLTQPADSMFAPMPQDELIAYLASRGMVRADTLIAPCNITLLRHEDSLGIFDAGSGSRLLDSVGDLPDALVAAGVDAGDETNVVFAHGHADHLWGVLDDFDDPFFYNAEHMIGRDEFDYWINPETVSTVAEERVPMAVGAARRLEIMADCMTLFDDSQEIIPGISARVTFGHTPGHMSFDLRSGSQSAMVIGDALINNYTAFDHPEWPIGDDQNLEPAASTRLSLLDQLSHEPTAMIGFHLSDGGLGHVERTGDSYRFAALGN